MWDIYSLCVCACVHVCVCVTVGHYLIMTYGFNGWVLFGQSFLDLDKVILIKMHFNQNVVQL